LFDNSNILTLTVNQNNIENYLHNNLQKYLAKKIGFKDSLRLLIENNENRVEIAEPDFSKELFFLSDQGRMLRNILSVEEILFLLSKGSNDFLELAVFAQEVEKKGIEATIEAIKYDCLDRYLNYCNNTYLSIINFRNPYNETLLHIAIKKDQTET
jgi:hypothetical protein